MYKNNTETNLQIGEINLPKLKSGILLRSKLINALKRAEIKVKAYQREFELPRHVYDVYFEELFNELK